MAHARKRSSHRAPRARAGAACVYLLGFFLAFCLLQEWLWSNDRRTPVVVATAHGAGYGNHLMHGHLLAFHEAAMARLCRNAPAQLMPGVFMACSAFMGFSLLPAPIIRHHSYLAPNGRRPCLR